MGERCAECGMQWVAGEADCAALRDALLARDFEEPVRYWKYHRLAVDAYCVQHEPYVRSAKSLAAHLCGLCVFFEHGNDEEKMRGVQLWLSGNPKLVKPVLPKLRGSLTIKDVSRIEDPAAYGPAVEAWARSAWDAYGELQPVAREWLAMCCKSPRPGKGVAR